MTVQALVERATVTVKAAARRALVVMATSEYPKPVGRG
jgi:hypothetical protein